MNATPVVLVTSRSFSSGALDLESELTGAGARVVRGATDHDLVGLAPLLAEASIWIAGASPVTRELIDLAPRLRLIARYGVGVEAVDRPAAAERGVVITNTPGANSDAVADHTVALLLAALRGVTEGDRHVREGDWTVRRTRELAQLTVGIVGFGRIGRGVAARLSGFGVRIVAADPFVPASALETAGVRSVSLEELPALCDVVSLHASGGAAIVDEAWLERARPALILVNTARAGLVDDAALADALREGRVAVYATDTPPGEQNGVAVSPLLAAELADRTVFTPHVGAQTIEAVDRMGRAAVDAALAVLRGEAPPNEVPPPDGLEGKA